MSANACRWQHGTHNLYFLIQVYELQRHWVVESLVADQLLQKGYKLDCLILIWLRQVDIFEVDHQSGTLFRLEGSSLARTAFDAHLVQFVNDLASISLRVAVNHSKVNLMCFSKFDKALSDE